MAKVTVYHNPRCSKSRQALEVLDESLHDVEMINYLEEGVSEEVLRMGLEQLGFEKFIRSGEEAFKKHVEGQGLNENQLLEILKEHPILMQRPLLVKEDKCILGRDATSLKAFV